MASQGTAPTARETAESAAALGRDLTPGQAGLLAAYLGLLIKWNRKMNLVGPGDWRHILGTLISDSWHVADFLSEAPVDGIFPADGAFSILDFGAGAGLPGIPLRMFWGRGRYYFIEARAKRAIFLRQALAELRLENASVFEGRAEKFLLEEADAAGFTLFLSRAFMPWPEFLALAANASFDNYAVLVMTGEEPRPELAPEGLSRLALKTYRVGGKERYASVFTPVIASR